MKFSWCLLPYDLLSLQALGQINKCKEVLTKRSWDAEGRVFGGGGCCWVFDDTIDDSDGAVVSFFDLNLVDRVRDSESTSSSTPAPPIPRGKSTSRQVREFLWRFTRPAPPRRWGVCTPKGGVEASLSEELEITIGVECCCCCCDCCRWWDRVPLMASFDRRHWGKKYQKVNLPIQLALNCSNFDGVCSYIKSRLQDYIT